MSIVKMKRLRVIGLAEERDALLSQLLHMGCVEVSEPEDKVTDPEWAALVKRDVSSLSDVKSEASGLTSALDALKKYAPAKGGLFRKRDRIGEKEFFSEQAKASALECAAAINDCTREIAKLNSTGNKLSSTWSSLQPWAGLELPLEYQGTAQTAVLLGACPAAVELNTLESDLAEATELAELMHVSADKDQQYFLLVAHREVVDQALAVLRPHSFSVVRFKDMTGTAAENIALLNKQLDENKNQVAEQEAAITAQAHRRYDLELALDRVNQEISKETVAERFLTDGTIFFAEGWIPAPEVEYLGISLKNFTCAWDTEDPAADAEDVPTLLKNPKWMECINMVTEMYSLPHYRGIDPNPLMFFWYVFFFGFMFADVAYGIIIFAVSLLVTKLYHPKGGMGRMFQLGMWLGGSTALCGIFVGGFFGNALEVIYDTFLPGVAMPGWMESFCSGLLVNPVNDPMTVLILAVAVGAVHLVMGQCIHIYMGFRDGTGVDALLDVVPWWILFGGIGMIALGAGPVGLIVGVVALVCTQGRHKKGIFGKLFGGVASLYDITSWLSDVLSYARLMALMLATSVIAQVFNTLGSLGGKSVVGIAMFVVVFLIGHIFNIGVNLIGTYVHAARLQYLEYFNKFYVSGGIPFRPLKYNTKYVDIDNKEEN